MNKELILHTIQISKVRLLPSDVKVIDTTVMTGNLAFAPSWDMVHGVKSGSLSEENYTTRYQAMMKESQISFKKEWDNLMQYKKIALACYCRANVFCHRHLLKDLIIQYLDKDDYEIHDAGEYEPA